MAGTFTNLIYHIVFSTKGRRQYITAALEPDLYKYIAGIIHDEKGTALEIGGTKDHIHIVTTLKPAVSVSEIVRLVKSNSSKWINDRGNVRTKFGWQSGYSAFTVSESQLSAVRRYVKNQKDHHRKLSFREELVALMEKHGIEYDDRYLLD